MLKYLAIKKIVSHIKYYGQFILFVSSASISQHSVYEKNTDIPELRFKNFKFSKYFPVILYLKPVLKNITYKDISLYKDLIKSYNIKYVVDIHGLASFRDMDINLGTNLGRNIESDVKIFDDLADNLKRAGFVVSVDQPFSGDIDTIAG